ncbi:hypothetical protein [Crassaminicella profunda]|uniref:hypothetical protein n=1 Tax=Crassaminicella profunda TaxID=1286698 RepID=UPI001CA79CFC|nr:hypothetical protein [Crassaminicella profunda]QZY55350.1 hypothetical protein K7H06_20530 [Crassaminicella profunda]
MAFGKQLGLFLRFIYGYLIGFIFISIIYIVVGITVILFRPEPFSIFVVEYIQEVDHFKLKITLLGHLVMGLFGVVEWMKCKNEIRRRKKKRRKRTYE